VEGFNALAEKIFDGDQERVANAMMGLSKFHHGDGVHGREWSVMYQQPYMQWIEAPAGTKTAVPMARDADTNELTIKAGCAPKRKAERADGFRTMFKAIGGSYTNAMVAKKLKTADGTPAGANLFEGEEGDSKPDCWRSDPAARHGILVTIAQFELSEAADIINKFGGSHDFLLQGHVSPLCRR
jgi:hypothetical protein